MAVMICPQDDFLLAQMAYLSSMNPPAFANRLRSVNRKNTFACFDYRIL